MDSKIQSTCKTTKMQAYLILVGLLFFCSLPLSQGQACRPDLLDKLNFPGHDITFGYSPDADHCQKLCTQYPKCFFFTFYQATWTRDSKKFRCYLKFSTTGEPSSQTPLIGVTSGFSLKTCNPEKLLCLSKTYTNVGFLGTDYKFIFTASHKACQRVCTRDPNCQFFTFMKSDYTTTRLRYKCHLKYSTSAPRIHTIQTLSNVVSGFSNQLKVHQNYTNACAPKTFDSDIEGTDLETFKAASRDHCQALCSNQPCCAVFSYTSSSNTCKLKSSTSVETKVDASIKSGLPVFRCLMANTWLAQVVDTDFTGCGYKTIQNTADVATCQNACNADRNCQFFTWVKNTFSDITQRQRCYLKRVITMPAPRKVVALTGAVSGFSTNICL